MVMFHQSVPLRLDESLRFSGEAVNTFDALPQKSPRTAPYAPSTREEQSAIIRVIRAEALRPGATSYPCPPNPRGPGAPATASRIAIVATRVRQTSCDATISSVLGRKRPGHNDERGNSG